MRLGHIPIQARLKNLFRALDGPGLSALLFPTVTSLFAPTACSPPIPYPPNAPPLCTIFKKIVKKLRIHEIQVKKKIKRYPSKEGRSRRKKNLEWRLPCFTQRGKKKKKQFPSMEGIQSYFSKQQGERGREREWRRSNAK